MPFLSQNFTKGVQKSAIRVLNQILYGPRGSKLSKKEDRFCIGRRAQYIGKRVKNPSIFNIIGWVVGSIVSSTKRLMKVLF